MTTAHAGRRAACLLALAVPLGLAGCGGAPTNSNDSQAAAAEDPLEIARESVRKATNVRAYRDALDPVNNHLAAQPKSLDHHWPTAKDRPALLRALGDVKGIDPAQLDDRALLRAVWVHRLGLAPDEVAELESVRFTPLDPHHVEYCIFLRDAARSLRLPERAGSSSALDQARAALGWVTRQVILGDKSGELEPPPFVLREGRGGPRERALIFLGLLRQFDLDGCIVAVPDKDGQPRHLFAGVLVADKGRGDVYLFDPRLGIPVPGPGGQGIATLADLRERPEVLAQLSLPDAPYDVTAEQAKRAAVYAAFPLSALSPRMGFLEEVLASHHRVSLAERPERLLERFAEAGIKDVQVWNEPGGPKAPLPRTPLRVLRQSLPPSEGGTDRDGGPRWAALHRQQMPLTTFRAAFVNMGLGELPNKAGEEQLHNVLGLLYQQFVITPREEIQRGRLEEASRRLVRGQHFVEEYVNARSDPEAFAKKVAVWAARAQQAYLDMTRGGNKQAFDAFWAEDQYLIELVRGEEPDRQKPRKALLGEIVFRAADEPLRKDMGYLQALRWHEVAEREQARYEFLEKNQAGTPSGRDKVRRDAAEAWKDAIDKWEKFAHEAPLPADAITRRVRAAREAAARSGPGEEFLGLVESLMADLRRSLHGRRLHAEALARRGDSKAAAARLRSVAREAAEVINHPDLVRLREDLKELLPSGQREVLDRVLFSDLRPDGAFEWLRRSARLQLRDLTGQAD